MLISIAMATYNGERFLHEQIESILNQSMQDFELIICDDNSTDSTSDILRQYEKNDDRIKVFFNNKRLGFKKNFEKAISLCSGDYIALSDQDDIWTLDHLEKLHRNLGDHSLSCANALMIDADGNSLHKKLNEVEHFYEFYQDKAIYTILLYRNCFQGASMLLKRNFVKNALPIPEDIPFHDTWLSACACLDKGIAYSFDVITYYRQHKTNITYSVHNITLKSYISIFFRRMKSALFSGRTTDRFIYVNELTLRFRIFNDDFKQIKNFFEEIQSKNFHFHTVIWLWNNYKYIMTNNTHKYFLLRLYMYYRWKDLT